ncbi:MAG TPA: hypothetical protein DHW10_02310, partial [Rhodospirillaceae bacterium]|nr:hypothetical protein [Rhodospirillaceae bacterium]
ITSAMLDMTDPDDVDTDVTYTVSNLSNGVIEVSGSAQTTFTQDDINNNRVVFIHDGSETTSAGFDISLADGGEDSVSPDTDSFAITVTPVNEAPTITVNTGVTMDEGASQTITSAMLDMADVDDADTDVTYTISNLSNGVIEVSGSVQTSFTQDDINNNRVVFVHDGSETTSAGFDISLADGGEDSVSPDTDSFAITITPVNEAPTITVNTGVTMDEGASQTITSAMLDMADVDDADTDVTYTASNIVAGHIEVSGLSQSTFTQDDINNNRVVFIHDGGETDASFDISLADGGEDSVSVDTGTFNITRINVNDAPTNVMMSANSFSELTDIGDTIGYLSTVDVDVPSDSFIYTIMADPDNMFSIFGNQLRLAAEADFETAISHSITIRTDDGNGGTFDRIFTLNVDDESELTLNTLPNDPTPNSGDGYLGIKIEEEGLREIGDNTLIHNLLSGDPAMQMGAFYTEYDFMQILRQNTTFEIQALLAQSSDTISFDPSLANTLLPEDAFGDTNTNEPLQENDLQRGEDNNVERLRTILEQLNDYDNDQLDSTNQDSDGLKISRKENPDLYDMFEETMHYHELRQQRLKDALMAES